MQTIIEKTESIDSLKTVLLSNLETKFFTYNELKQSIEKNKIKSLGARYIIKLALLEHLGLKDNYHEIEILNNKQGKPELIVKGEVKKQMKNQLISNYQLSISHSKNYIATLVILE